MIRPLLEQYLRLTEFLGRVLGPDYEVALHDLTRPERSLIAIANGHVSGRSVGAPLTDLGQKMLQERSYADGDYWVNYLGLDEHGKTLRSSTFIITNGGEPLGMLCINFDDSKYQAVSESILKLCHPDAFVETNFQLDEARVRELNSGSGEAEAFTSSLRSNAISTLERALKDLDGRAMTVQERLQLIRTLDAEGAFLLKGSLLKIAERLGVSQATLYRDLKRTRK